MESILVVDDDETIRNLMGRLLERNGYRYSLASSANEARKLLKEYQYQLVLCDVEMPDESGLELTGYINAEYPNTAVMMISGIDDPRIAEKAIELGAYGYVVKPFKPNELIINIKNSLRRLNLEIERKNYEKELEREVILRTKALQDSLINLRKAIDGIIQAIATTVEVRDPYTAGHQRRVAQLSRAIAIELNLQESVIEGVYMAGLIHDLGKISVPAEILSKPGCLTDPEFSIIKSHPQTAYDILKPIEFPWPIAEIVLQHHERMDGSGYPRGISGDYILLESRIISVADVVEALSSHRPYRPALGIEKALQEISSNMGKLYDLKVAEACLRLFREKRFNFED
jgi:response regulator RpfG family c-di-GMP phosphodiesterase